MVMINSCSETMRIYILYFFICEHVFPYESLFLCQTLIFSFCNETYSCTKNIRGYKYKLLVSVITEALSDLDLDFFFLILFVPSIGIGRESDI